MKDLIFEIDLKDIEKIVNGYKKSLQDDVVRSAESLASMTHAKTLELAKEELSSSYKLYSDNVEFSNPSPNFWVVTLKSPALWIEEGRKSGFMEELLKGKSSKLNKKGERYAVIPFEHSKNPTEQSPQAQLLANQIKEHFKKQGINWKKIERNKDGSPRLGKLHSFNINNPRLKPQHKTSPTHGVSVYQTKTKDGNVRRDVLTFRIITEKHKNENLWIHPGRKGNKILDKAFEWAEKTWENEILPSILDKYK